MEFKSANEYSPLVLAYLGDVCYELYVRSRLVRSGDHNVNILHRMSTDYVKAKAQSGSIHALEAVLTEEEAAVYRRGRNAKSAVPKNADMAEYRHATGFEAVLGYLYIKGEEERLDELMELACKAVEQ